MDGQSKVGQSVLDAAALGVQGHADVVLPIGPGQARPVSLYLGSIAASGERKSSSDAEAMWPIRQREAALRTGYDSDFLRYANDQAAYEQARKAAEKTGKGNREETRAGLNALGPAPVPCMGGWASGPPTPTPSPAGATSPRSRVGTWATNHAHRE